MDKQVVGHPNCERLSLRSHGETATEGADTGGGLLSWPKLSVVNLPVELLNTSKTASSGTTPFGTVRDA
jgi:hypothetical protein